MERTSPALGSSGMNSRTLHRRAYTCHGLAEGEQRLEQRVERRHRILLVIFSL